MAEITIEATGRSPQDCSIAAVAASFRKQASESETDKPRSRVFVFDAEAAKLIGNIELPFPRPDCLAFMPLPEPQIIASTYYDWGIGAFDLQGHLLWHRRDLKKAASLIPIPRHPEKPRVAVEFEKLTSRLLNSVDGREAAFPISGADDIHCSPDGKLGFCISRKRMVLFSFESKTAIFSISTDRKIDAVGFSASSLLVSWRDWNGVAKGSHIECLDLSGRSIWQKHSDEDWYSEFYWNASLGKWLAVGCGRRRRFGCDDFVMLAPDSGDMERHVLPMFDLRGVYPGHAYNRFLANGSLMLDQACRVLRVPGLEPVFDLIETFKG